MKYRQLNLNLLVVLDILLREQSVGRAALRLNLTQAAVSLQLARLRAHFGDDLLVQSGRRTELTRFAADLRAPLATLLEETEAFLELRSSFDPGQAERRFRIATADIETAVLLSRVNRRLSSEAPGIHLHVNELHPGRRLESNAVAAFLDQKNNDFIIVPRGVHSESHPFETLYEQSYVCLLCRDNPLVGENLSREQYLSLTHVVRLFGDDDCPTFDGNYFHTAGLERKIGPVVDTYMLIPHMLVGTPYVATVHARLAEDLMARYPLRVVPCPVDLPRIESVLQWRTHLDQDPAAIWLRGLLQEVAPTQSLAHAA